MVLAGQEILDDIEIPSDDSEDEDIDAKAKSRRHKKLLKDIGVKTRKKRKSTRNEPAREISEFSWSSGTKNKLELHDLVGSLESSKQSVAALKKKLRKMENTSKILDKPLSKPETQAIERTVAYQDAATHMTKWNPTVQKNREAEQLLFPLNQYVPPPVSTTMFVNNFEPRNDLEREINEVLKGSQHLLERKDKELTEAEEAALKAYDLEVAMQRRKELQKARALQSYYEAKCRRKKKIKSKKYHRIQRKEQQKVLNKVDLETLSKENPELFERELEKAEKMRALERASLRHRNTSKWAKNMILKGNKTKEDQESVREQLRLSRQLTEHKTIGGSEDEDETEMNIDDNEQRKLKLLENTDSAENPWLLGTAEKLANDNKDKGKVVQYKKLRPLVTKESAQYQEEDNDDEELKSSGDEWNQPDSMSENKKKELFKKRKKSVTKNKKRIVQNRDIVNDVEKKTGSDLESNQDCEGVEKSDAANIIPERVITNESKSISSKNHSRENGNKKQSDALRFLKDDAGAVELVFNDDSSEDDEVYDTEQRMNIREAFANDDVIADFVQEKSDLIEKSQPKAEDLTLPGWGEWAGSGLTVSVKKTEKFTKHADPTPKRKDDGKGNVIINEIRNNKLAKHQVSELPFPYSNQAEFERSIRQPIGEHWNTPSVHNKLIEPRIRTLPGVVIDPLKPSKRLKKKLKKGK